MRELGGVLLGGSRVGSGSQKEEAERKTKVVIFSSISHFFREGKGLEMELILDHAYMRQPP